MTVISASKLLSPFIFRGNQIITMFSSISVIRIFYCGCVYDIKLTDSELDTWNHSGICWRKSFIIDLLKDLLNCESIEEKQKLTVNDNYIA